MTSPAQNGPAQNGPAQNGPAQNRVAPSGEIVAAPGRGAWMGNRGVLHEGRDSRSVVRAARGRAWIICMLSFKDRTLPQWEPGRNTQLFFLDEAVALAAGHRPCAECRRGDYNRFRRAWAGPDAPSPSARELDAVLASERATPGDRRPHPMDWAAVPDGAFVLGPHGPGVVAGDHLAPWRPDNTYGEHLDRPRRGTARVLTPASTVRALRAGCAVQLDDAATGPSWSGSR